MNGLRTLISFFGFGLKTRMDSLEKRHDEMMDSVQFKDVCDQARIGCNIRLDEMTNMQKEMRTDIKKLLAREV